MHQLVDIVPQPPVAAGVSTSRDEPLGAGSGDVYVLFTSTDETLSAVRVARRLAHAMRGGVTVVHFQPVGFGAPLEAPTGLSPVETDTFMARLEAEDCDARIRVCLCRDVRQAIPSVLPVHSLIVIGGRRRWWPTPSARWRRTLEARGYVVASVND